MNCYIKEGIKAAALNAAILCGSAYVSSQLLGSNAPLNFASSYLYNPEQKLLSACVSLGVGAIQETGKLLWNNRKNTTAFEWTASSDISYTEALDKEGIKSLMHAYTDTNKVKNCKWAALAVAAIALNLFLTYYYFESEDMQETMQTFDEYEKNSEKTVSVEVEGETVTGKVWSWVANYRKSASYQEMGNK